jgi:hypothetical protein
LVIRARSGLMLFCDGSEWIDDEEADASQPTTEATRTVAQGMDRRFTRDLFKTALMGKTPSEVAQMAGSVD